MGNGGDQNRGHLLHLGFNKQPYRRTYAEVFIVRLSRGPPAHVTYRGSVEGIQRSAF